MTDIQTDDLKQQLPDSQIAALLGKKGPEQWVSLKNSLTLCPGNLTPRQLEAFVKDPKEYPVTPAQAEFLQEWLMGYFAISNSTGDMIRVRSKPGAAVMLGVKAPSCYKKAEDYVPTHELLRVAKYLPIGQGVAGMVQIPATNQGKDMLGADERKYNAAKKAEREAAEERIAREKKPTVVQGLMKFGKSA